MWMAKEVTWETRRSLNEEFDGKTVFFNNKPITVLLGYGKLASTIYDNMKYLLSKGKTLTWEQLGDICILAKFYQLGGIY